MRLVVCSSCSRHVRAAEKTCAFCGAEIASRGTGAHLAAAIAIVAATTAIACGQREIAQPYGVPMPLNDGRDAAANPVPPDATDGGTTVTPSLVTPPPKP